MSLVFIVDDHADTRDSLSLLLSMDGFSVMCFPTFESALAEFSTNVPVLIIADAVIPGGQSLAEFIAAVRKTSPATRVLVNSGSVQHREKSEEAGADGFILKPDDVRTWMNASGFFSGDGMHLGDVNAAC